MKSTVTMVLDSFCAVSEQTGATATLSIDIVD